MRLTDKIKNRFYRDCVKKAEFALGVHTYPLSVEDVAPAAFLHGIGKVRRAKYDPKTWKNALLCIAECSVKNEIRDLLSGNDGLNHRAARIDEPNFGDVRDHRQTVDIDPPLPDWQIMTRIQIAKERRVGKRIVNRLMETTDTLIKAMHHVGVSLLEIRHFAKKLQCDFNQCLQAYHECLAQNCKDADEYRRVIVYGGMNDVGNGLGSCQDD